MSAKVQRLRVTFSRGEEIKYITHLDLTRTLERVLRRAEIPVSYSEGFSPHAQIALAAPLPVGTTGEAELLDVFLSERLSPAQFLERLTGQLPPGLTVNSVEEVGLTLPALQADVRWADYEVDLPGSADEATAAVDRFLAAETVPWEHKREDEVRQYDIRAQVQDVAVAPVNGTGVRLRMRLKNDNTGSGRPEQVVAALGLQPPSRILRKRLVLSAKSPSREAWRKRGRFAT